MWFLLFWLFPYIYVMDTHGNSKHYRSGCWPYNMAVFPLRWLFCDMWVCVLRRWERGRKGQCVYKVEGEEKVRVLCFTGFCGDALLYYSAQGALHHPNGFSLISTAAWGGECTQKQARANLFFKKKMVYFSRSGGRTWGEPIALMLQQWHSTR